MSISYVDLPRRTRAGVLLSAVLFLAIIALLLSPGPACVRTFGSTARNLFLITESDYLNPLLSTARAVTILNCAAEQVAHFAGYDDFSTRIDIDDTIHVVNATRYNGGLFSLLGIRFLRVEPLSQGTPAVYITESFWERAFARNESVLGTPVRIHGATFTVAGVTRNPSGLLATTDIWMPISGRGPLASMSSMRIMGALQPGVDWRNAQKALAKCFAEYLQDQPYSERPGTRLLPVEASISFREAAPSIASVAPARARFPRT